MFFSLQLSFCFLAAILALVNFTPTRYGTNVNGIGVLVSNPDTRNIITNRYIVVYKKNATDDAV
jgi:hypothetical protein